MAIRSGGERPPANKEKKTVSFQDNLEAQEGGRPNGEQPAKDASRKRKSRLLFKWVMIIILLLMSFAVAIWGLRQSAFIQEFMDIRFPTDRVTPEAVFTPGAAPDRIPDQQVEAPDSLLEPSPLAGDPGDPEAMARRLAALEAGLASLENRPVPVLSPDLLKTTPDPAMVRVLETMETTIARLMDQVAELESRLARAEMSNERGWALVVAGAGLRIALRGSAPFAAELEAFRGTLAGLHAADGADGALNTTLAALEAYASEGIPDMKALSLEFDVLAPRIVAVGNSGDLAMTEMEEKNWMKTLRQHMAALVTIRRTGSGLVGSSAEAVVARAEAALETGNLAAAVSDLETLQGSPGGLVASWLDGARARLAAEQSLTEISRLVTAILKRDETRQAPDVKEGAEG